MAAWDRDARRVPQRPLFRRHAAGRSERPGPWRLTAAFARNSTVRKDGVRVGRTGQSAMPREHAAPDAAALLQSSAIFGKLPNEQRAEIWSRARVLALSRGEILVRQNAPSDTVYVV